MRSPRVSSMFVLGGLAASMVPLALGAADMGAYYPSSVYVTTVSKFEGLGCPPDLSRIGLNPPHQA